MREGDSCTKCRIGKFKEREGKYGTFLSCDRFPRCKNTAKIEGEKSDYKSGLSRDIAPPEEYKPIDLSRITLSDYQSAILRAVRETSDNLIIYAAAGSGKSFTLRLIAQSVNSSLSILYATFDKRSTEDIKSKLPPHVIVSTWHAYGFRAIKSQRKTTLNEYKISDIIREFSDRENEYNQEIIEEVKHDLARIVSRAKNALYLPSESIPWEDIAVLCGVSLNGNESYLSNVLDYVFQESARRLSEVDFDDMIYLPAARIVHVTERYDLALLDESQDLNACQIELAKNAASRVVIVGDPFQAIYLFRGADSESMNRLKLHFSAVSLPLSICYRCGTNIISAVNARLPEIPILPHVENHAGEVNQSIDYQAMIERIKPGDNILCRTNAPLVKPCFDFIRAGIKATILGRDIGKNLVSLVSKMSRRINSQDMNLILVELSNWTMQQCERLEKRGKLQEIEKFIDQRDTIAEIAAEINTLQEFRALIENLFSDSREGIILSTVHKSKGSEADNIFILKPDLMPLPKGDAREENNIIYVAMTRAKKTLSFINPENH